MTEKEGKRFSKLLTHRTTKVKMQIEENRRESLKILLNYPNPKQKGLSSFGIKGKLRLIALSGVQIGSNSNAFFILMTIWIISVLEGHLVHS